MIVGLISSYATRFVWWAMAKFLVYTDDHYVISSEVTRVLVIAGVLTVAWISFLVGLNR